MNKAGGGGDGIPAELFQILKDDYKSPALSMPTNLENSAVATGLERSVFIPIPKKVVPKKVQTTSQLHLFHMLAN